MRILYLTQWFEPEPVVKGVEFVRELEKAGHEVVVVTGVPNYPSGRVYPAYRIKLFQTESLRGVTVVRLPLYPSHDGSSLRRSLNFLSFFISALLYGLVNARRFDVIYAYHPPITVGLAAALFGSVHRVPFVLDVQDLWPDTIVASGMTGTSRLASLLGYLCNFTYRRSTRIIVLSEGMRAKLIERRVPEWKVVTVYNWTDEAIVESALARTPDRCQADGPFTIVYGGNFGPAQALHTVVRAAKLASSKAPNLQVVLIGEGIDEELLKNLSKSIDAENVRFMARVSMAEVVRLFAAADILLLHLAKKPLFEVTIPSKTQLYLAIGRPILAGVAGDAADLVFKAGAGVTVPPEDPQALADAMVALSREAPEHLRQMGERGRAFYNAHLSFARSMSVIVTVINDIQASIRGRRHVSNCKR